MTGEALSNVLYMNKINKSKLAEMLGVSQQSLSQLFKADDVKSGWLEKIASALGKDMSFFYPCITFDNINNNVHVREQHAHNLHNGSGTINDGDSELMVKLLNELSELRKQNQKLTDKLLG